VRNCSYPEDALLTFFNEHHTQHAPRFELSGGERIPPSERPERIDAVAQEFTRRGLGRIVTPHGVSLASLERARAGLSRFLKALP